MAKGPIASDACKTNFHDLPAQVHTFTKLCLRKYAEVGPAIPALWVANLVKFVHSIALFWMVCNFRPSQGFTATVTAAARHNFILVCGEFQL